jgi:hypothetical protein
VGATVGHRMDIATDTTMAHLSTSIFLSHARLKAELCSVGKDSPPADREHARRRLRTMSGRQGIRSRWPSTSEAALERTGARPLTWAAYLAITQTRFPAPSALPQGQKSDPDSPPYEPVTEDDEPVEPALKRPRSSSTAIDSRQQVI